MLNELRKVELLLCLLLCLGCSATAQMFYAASEPTQQLDLVNFTAGTVTDIYDVGDRPDSLVVNAQGQILYTVSSAGTLQMFDPKTGTNSELWNFGQASPRDMLFEPGGASVLISLYATAQLARYNLTTGAVTIFPQKIQQLGSSLDGLAYDPAGNLYAVVSHNTVCQLDPNTGAILQTLALEPHNAVNGGDGMVYDAFTKNLWVSHDGTLGNGLIEVPLTQSTPPVLGAPILLQTGNLHVPDGILSDGKGSLYIGEGLQFLTQYDIASDTIVRRVQVPIQRRLRR
jgi:sugar lactone lactonase YvrE